MKIHLILLIAILSIFIAGYWTQVIDSNNSSINNEELPEMQEDENMTHSSVVGQSSQFLNTVSSVKNLEMDIKTQEVKNYYQNATGIIARPDNDQSYPGVVLIHEWWGLNDHIKEVAIAMAQEGYTVFAVDLYNGEVAHESSKAMELRKGVNQTIANENMQTALNYLRNKEQVTQVASLRFCFGGEQSAQFSLSQADLDATVIFYGTVPQNTTSAQGIDAPVFGVFGEQDSGIAPESVNNFKQPLNELGVENNITIYEGVGHAFVNP